MASDLFCMQRPAHPESWWRRRGHYSTYTINHGCEAIRDSLNPIRPLLCHNGLTAAEYIWTSGTTASLVAPALPFFPRSASLIQARASEGMGPFWACRGSFGWCKICSTSTYGVGFGVPTRARRAQQGSTISYHPNQLWKHWHQARGWLRKYATLA